MSDTWIGGAILLLVLVAFLWAVDEGVPPGWGD
jgi:hypothetical protein